MWYILMLIIVFCLGYALAVFFGSGKMQDMEAAIRQAVYSNKTTLCEKYLNQGF